MHLEGAIATGRKQVVCAAQAGAVLRVGRASCLQHHVDGVHGVVAALHAHSLRRALVGQVVPCSHSRSELHWRRKWQYQITEIS